MNTSSEVILTSFMNFTQRQRCTASITKDQCSVIHCRWAKELRANVIQSEMRPVYGDKYFTRPAIQVWCKKFAHGRESVADEERPGRPVVSTTDATITAVYSLMRSNRRVMGRMSK